MVLINTYLGIVTTNKKVSSINDLKTVPVNYITVPRGGLGQWATRAMLGAHGITYGSYEEEWRVCYSYWFWCH